MIMKKNSILNLLLIFTTGLFISCLKGATEAVSSGSPVSASGSTSSAARWDSYNLDLKIASDVYDATERNLIATMGTSWETAASNTNFFNFGTTTNKDYAHLDSFYDSEMGVYKSSHWFSEVSATALAITQYFGYRSGAYINLVHADIILNDSGLFAFSTTQPTPAGHYDLPSIAVHELGHFLGLSHNLSESSVMRPSLASGSTNRTLTSADNRDIRNRYGMGVSGLNSANAIAVNVDTSNDGQQVRGIIELHADGNCKHYENGVLIHSHNIH